MSLSDTLRVLGLSPHSTVAAGASPGVAPAGTARVYFESDTDQLLVSIDTGPWTPLAGAGGASGWVDDGAVVRLATQDDRVGVGIAGATAKLHVVGTAIGDITAHVVPRAAQTADVLRVTNADGSVVHIAVRPDNGFAVLSSLALESDITPAGLAVSTNDYNPAGLANAGVIRLENTAGANINLTGLAGGRDGRELVINNISDNAAETITLTNQDAASVVANRFLLPGAASVVIRIGGSVRLWYDSTISRWKVQAMAL